MTNTQTSETSREKSPKRGKSRTAAIIGYVAFYLELITLAVCHMNGWFIHTIAITVVALLALTIITSIIMNRATVKQIFTSRRAGAGMSVLLSVTSGFAIYLLINYAASTWNTRIDITENQKFTLSLKTQKWIKSLEGGSEKQTLHIVGFLPYQIGSPIPEDYKQLVMETLKLYEQSVAITTTVVDPILESPNALDEATKLSLSGVPNGLLVMVLKDSEGKIVGRKDVAIDMLFKIPVSSPYGNTQRMATYRGEDAITSTLRDLLDDSIKTLYFLTGHGEGTSGNTADDYSGVLGILKDMNFVAKDLSLLETGRVPADTSAVIIAGPKQPIDLKEIRMLDDYLGSGGRLMVMLDPLSHDVKHSGIEDYLASFGVVAHTELTAQGRELAQQRFNVGHPNALEWLARDLGKKITRLYRACVLKEVPPKLPGYRTGVFLHGSKSSWGESSPTQIPARYDATRDIAGPVALGITVEPSENPLAKNEMKDRPSIVVFADSDFAANHILSLSETQNEANVDIFINAVNWLVGRTENIGIQPKKELARRVYTTQKTRRRLFWGIVVFPVLMMSVLGVLVWRARRK